MRWRTLFRSGEMQNITESDLLKARSELGIRAIVDLRGPDSISRVGTGPIADPPTNYRNIPFLTQGDGERQLLRSLSNMGDFYLNVIERPHFGPKVVEALQVAAEPHASPTVFHCTAEKDRTGMFAAFLLGVLGVKDEDIVRDYARSAAHMEKLKEGLRLNPEGIRLIEEMPAHTFESRPESMEMLLDYVNREYGSMKGYVLAHGAYEGLFTALEDALLE